MSLRTQVSFLKAIRTGIANWEESKQILERLGVEGRAEQEFVLEQLVQNMQAFTDEAMGKGDEHYQEFMEMYFIFYRRLTGTKPKIVPSKDAPALKSIIKYLRRESKTGDYQGAKDSWKFILKNWKTLNKFYQNQTKLTSINTNLNEIIMVFRNGTHDKKQLRNNQQEARKQLSDNLTDLL